MENKKKDLQMLIKIYAGLFMQLAERIVSSNALCHL